MLVALEGIDGCGKTTLLRALAPRLRRRGLHVVATEEPTRTWLGRAVRKGIRTGIDPLALAGLFLADRGAHVAALAPALDRGDLVLTDRYRDSTTAYQAAALAKRLPDAFELLRRYQARVFPAPDLVLWPDLPPRVALGRIQGRRVREPFERRRFLEAVRKNYARLARAEPRRWVRLDATQGASELAAAAEEAVLRARRRRR